MSRGVSPEAPAHFLYADEFHTFATERFATLLSEARKFRLGLVLAHQYTSQLTRRGDAHVLDAVLGNVGTTIAFRVGPRDAEMLAPVFAPRAKAADIASQPDFRAVVRSSGELGNVPFTLRTHGAPGGRLGLATAIRTLSQLRYGRDREIVEAEIVHTMSSFRTLARTGQSAVPALP
jgi:hypothetical protein